jgi:hypothetical protein
MCDSPEIQMIGRIKIADLIAAVFQLTIISGNRLSFFPLKGCFVAEETVLYIKIKLHPEAWVLIGR